MNWNGKIFFGAAIAFLLSWLYMPESNAQVAVSVALNRTNYLQYETIYARVMLRNYSGQTLAFSDSKELYGSLNFVIEREGGPRAELRKDAFNPLVGVIIAPGATEEVLVPVSSLYVLTGPGGYRLKAEVGHKLLNTEYVSGTINFTISNGMKVWERLVGVPLVLKKADGEKILPRTVKVVFFQDGKDKVYALMIEDEKYVYGVVRIGLDIGNFAPICEIDGLSRTHILAQVSPNVFSYFMYDIDCNLEKREVFVKSDTVPDLIADTKDGSVIVAGGRKAVKDVDYVEEEGQPVLINQELK